MTNSKALLIPSGGTNSWSGRMGVVGYGVRDADLALEALKSSFWIDDTFVEEARVFLFPKVQELRLSKAMAFAGMTAPAVGVSISLQTPFCCRSLS